MNPSGVASRSAALKNVFLCALFAVLTATTISSCSGPALPRVSGIASCQSPESNSASRFQGFGVLRIRAYAEPVVSLKELEGYDFTRVFGPLEGCIAGTHPGGKPTHASVSVFFHPGVPGDVVKAVEGQLQGTGLFANVEEVSYF